MFVSAFIGTLFNGTGFGDFTSVVIHASQVGDPKMDRPESPPAKIIQGLSLSFIPDGTSVG